MESKMIADFIKTQQALMSSGGGGSGPACAAKVVVRPDAVRKHVDESDPEAMYNEILEKKPAAKKVLRFLQVCIDAIVADDD
jgi:hypothetical protein